MAHRALVAYRRRDGRFDVHTSRWGGDRLATAIGSGRPFGTPPVSVDRDPLATGLAPDAVLTALDPVHETLVAVSPRYEATPYLSCSMALDGLGSPMLARTTPADATALRHWWVAAKSQVTAATDRGELDPVEARVALRDALARRARSVHDPYAGGGFLTPD